MSHKIIYLDTETGSTNPRNTCLLQLSGAIEIDWKLKEKFNIFISPFEHDPEITKEATEKHGINEETIRLNPKKFIDPLQAYRQFQELLKKYVDPFNKTDKFILSTYVYIYINVLICDQSNKCKK